MLKTTNKQTNYKPVSTAKRQRRRRRKRIKTERKFCRAIVISTQHTFGIGENFTRNGRSSALTATKTTTMCNFYHVFLGAETEGFSFFWFSFRSVTTFYVLRGLLRLGVLPGLRGGPVPGRGEGKIYEVARNVGEVREQWQQQQRQKMPRFRRAIEAWRKSERRTGGESRNIFELQLFFYF